MNMQNKTQKRIPWPSRLHLYSNPRKAQRMAYKYLGKTAKLYPGTNREKKYSILNYLISKYNDVVYFKNKCSATCRSQYLNGFKTIRATQRIYILRERKAPPRRHKLRHLSPVCITALSAVYCRTCLSV